MGLDCSHDAFSGAYSAFNRLRKAVAKAANGSFPPHDDVRLDGGRWYVPDEYTQEEWPGLYIFLSHSDCDGEISPEDCALVARDLERLLPKLSGDGGGHLARVGGYTGATQKFIAGCNRAYESGEPLEFH